jgi:mono/diheme cytochrome c family protein
LKRILKKAALAVVALLVIVGAGGGIYACSKASTFDASMEKVYDVAAPSITRSTDPAVIERGKHLASSVAPCAASKCHGVDLGGGESFSMGPLATITGPNISQGGLGATYTDADLARMIRHGIKKDGRSLRFMPAQDFAWLPDADIVAIVSYLRTLPPVDRANGPMSIGLLGKVLDVNGKVELDVARRIDHDKPDLAPPASATAAYGKYVTRLCTGCHGAGLSGGPIPGAPKSMGIPLNLTPHESGLKDWSYDDFDKVITTGIRKNGQSLAKLMPVEAFGKMNDTEKRAMWEHLRTLPPTPFGNR